MILKITRLSDGLVLILIVVDVNEIISGDGLELILLKCKKTNIIKSKNVAKSKYLTNLFNPWNVDTCIRAIKFLIFKAKVTFT